MINHLIAKAREVLVAALGSVIANAVDHIVSAPVALPTPAQLPLLVLATGDLTIIHQVSESQNSQPRPQGYQQRFTVNQVTPAGPYPLDHQPLQGTAQAVVILAEGQLAERRLRLQENKDFTIDYAAQTVTMISNLSLEDVVLFTYSFVGIFTVKDFEQEFSIEIYTAEVSQLEQLASLASGALLTVHDELVQDFNQAPAFQTVYTAGAVTTTHLLSRLQFQAGHMAYTPSLKMSLHFMASGQLTAARAISEGFGLIEKIHSPGITSPHPVDIDIIVE